MATWIVGHTFQTKLSPWIKAREERSRFRRIKAITDIAAIVRDVLDTGEALARQRHDAAARIQGAHRGKVTREEVSVALE